VLQDAQSRFPKDPDSPSSSALCSRSRRAYSEAETAFKQALQRDPNHAPTLNYLGYMLPSAASGLTSRWYIKKALDLEPNNGSYLDSLGWAYYKDG
jgi:Tfp pilus assembly protein PilF